jgi:phage terminase large subunit-like protein
MAWHEWPGQVQGQPGTLAHFKRWASELVFEDGKRHPPERWQLDFMADVLHGYEECWLIVPEGNSKTTFIAEICLYHLEVTNEPWVPIGAASRDQAEILFTQAKGFIERTPGLLYMKDGPTVPDENALPGERGSCDGPYEIKGTRLIKHRFNGGQGLKVYAADKDTADGVIPTLPVIDEGHRHRDLGLYRLWKGKCEKRGASIVMISTSGEPGSDFEKSRDSLRQHATKSTKRGVCFGRYETDTSVLHEYAVPDRRLVEDISIVKQANPLAKITEESLRRKRASPTLDYGEGWLRLTCNIPARSSSAAVNEADWDDAVLEAGQLEEAPEGILPKGVPIIVGADFAWSLDTTALVPLWIPHRKLRLIGQAWILEPPRDGTTLSPVHVRDAFLAIHARNPIKMVVMDTTKAEDTMLWLEEEIGCDVVDRSQGNANAQQDYDAFMQALRGGAAPDSDVVERWLRWCRVPDIVVDGTTGEREEIHGALRSHIMNAIARKLPGDKYRFDRPATSRSAALQEVRVIDGLTALGMANCVGGADLMVEPKVPMVAVVGR